MRVLIAVAIACPLLFMFGQAAIQVGPLTTGVVVAVAAVLVLLADLVRRRKASTMARHSADCVCTRCCDRDEVQARQFDTIRSDREESRVALRGESGTECHGGDHRMVPDGAGGGQCIYCPVCVSRDEL